MKIAYFSDKVQLPMAAINHPVFDRIRPLADDRETVHYSTFTHKGQKGVMCHSHIAPPPPGDLTEGVVCADGLIYFRYGPMPDQFELSRINAGKCYDHITQQKRTLSIPIAACSAQTISFSGTTTSKYVDQFAILANDLLPDFMAAEAEKDEDQDEGGIDFSDPRIFALVFLAIQKAYRVTQEMMDELNWITNEDVNPIIMVIYGIDPKLSGRETSTAV